MPVGQGPQGARMHAHTRPMAAQHAAGSATARAHLRRRVVAHGIGHRGQAALAHDQVLLPGARAVVDAVKGGAHNALPHRKLGDPRAAGRHGAHALQAGDGRQRLGLITWVHTVCKEMSQRRSGKQGGSNGLQGACRVHHDAMAAATAPRQPAHPMILKMSAGFTGRRCMRTSTWPCERQGQTTWQ